MGSLRSRACRYLWPSSRSSAQTRHSAEASGHAVWQKSRSAAFAHLETSYIDLERPTCRITWRWCGRAASRCAYSNGVLRRAAQLHVRVHGACRGGSSVLLLQSHGGCSPAVEPLRLSFAASFCGVFRLALAFVGARSCDSSAGHEKMKIDMKGIIALKVSVKGPPELPERTARGVPDCHSPALRHEEGHAL